MFKANERLSSFANVCPRDGKYLFFFAESVRISIRDECERRNIRRENSLSFPAYIHSVCICYNLHKLFHHVKIVTNV